MTEEKNTTYMRIKVDLQCLRCRKKIKKVLCKFPQIRDQVYNEKENYVVIKVVCCCPEKVKQKIICKGGVTITNIEIIEIEKKPPEEEKKKKEEEEKEPPTNGRPKDVKPDDADMPKPPEKPKGPLKAKEPEKPKEKPPPQCPQQLAYPVPFGTCCTECYEVRGGGPCYSGHGRPPPCYDGYYGRPIYDSYGGGGYRGSYGIRCDYLSEENPSVCSIM